MYNMTQFKGNV